MAAYPLHFPSESEALITLSNRMNFFLSIFRCKAWPNALFLRQPHLTSGLLSFIMASWIILRCEYALWKTHDQGLTIASQSTFFKKPSHLLWIMSKLLGEYNGRRPTKRVERWILGPALIAQHDLQFHRIPKLQSWRNFQTDVPQMVEVL